MARCPFCGGEIDRLLYHCRELVQYVLTSDGELKQRAVHDVYGQSLRCPDCNEEITWDYDSAMSFLEGKVILVRGDDYRIVGARPLRGGSYILCNGRIYKLVEDPLASFETRFFNAEKVYKLVDDEVIESIIAAAES